MIFQAGFSWSSNSLLMFWCRLIPWLHVCLCCSGAVMVMPLFYRTVFTDTGLLNFIPLPVMLVVCLVLLHMLFYFAILHADVDSPVLAWRISELLWAWAVLNCPENVVCHGWWEAYIVCIWCCMNILLMCLYEFCTCDGRAVLTVFYLVGCFMGSSSGMESCVTAYLFSLKTLRWTSLVCSFASSKMFAQCVNVGMMLHFRARFLSGLAFDLYF